MRTWQQPLFGWLPLFVWMWLIFAGSTDVLSGEHTSRFIVPFLRWLCHGTVRDATLEQVHFLIRKCGHLCEYAVLAVLAWNALRRSIAAGGWRTFGLSILFTAAYAAGDEFHQSFVPSRSASVGDVLIDIAGGIAGLVVLQGCRRIRRRWAEAHRRRDKS